MKRRYRRFAQLVSPIPIVPWRIGVWRRRSVPTSIIRSPSPATRRLRRRRSPKRTAYGEATPVEKGLIEAIDKRYSENASEDPLKCDRNYSAALLDLARQFPGDPDVSALAAEALMVVQCKLSSKDKQKAEVKSQVEAILERVLKNYANHPFGLHLWIHAMDLSRQPERARVESDRLRQLAPGIGHMMHMPSHIDIRVGRWNDAVLANERALAADHVFRRALPQRGSHAIYMAHNEHMLIYAAMMQGQSAKALRAADEVLSLTPSLEAQVDPGTVDVFNSMADEIRMRFGQWDAILQQPEPGFALPFSCAIRHFARHCLCGEEKNLGGKSRAAGIYRGAAARCRELCFSAFTARFPCSTLPRRCWRERFSTAREKLRREWRHCNPPSLPRTSWITPTLLFGCSPCGMLWRNIDGRRSLRRGRSRLPRGLEKESRKRVGALWIVT